MKQSKHNIYYSPKKVRTILERSIDTALDSLKYYCNDPVFDFTLCRKLHSIHHELFKSLLNRQIVSLFLKGMVKCLRLLHYRKEKNYWNLLSLNT